MLMVEYYPAKPTSARGSADKDPKTDTTAIGAGVELNNTMKIPLILYLL
jgi:hypothetical protein